MTRSCRLGERSCQLRFVMGARIGLGFVATATGDYAIATEHLDTAARLPPLPVPQSPGDCIRTVPAGTRPRQPADARAALDNARTHSVQRYRNPRLSRSRTASLERLSGQFEDATAFAPHVSPPSRTSVSDGPRRPACRACVPRPITGWLRPRPYHVLPPSRSAMTSGMRSASCAHWRPVADRLEPRR